MIKLRKKHEVNDFRKWNLFHRMFYNLESILSKYSRILWASINFDENDSTFVKDCVFFFQIKISSRLFYVKLAIFRERAKKKKRRWIIHEKIICFVKIKIYANNGTRSNNTLAAMASSSSSYTQYRHSRFKFLHII